MQQSVKEIKEIEQFITIDNEQIDTTLLSPSGKSKGKILMLHGAGESTKERLLPLAREITALGWSCLTFSLPGHGKSSGSLLGSTLIGRKKITYKIAEHFDFWPADIVLGISMGAHTAISMMGDNPGIVKKLLLMVPAVYAAEAEEVPFGPEFSEILRTSKSYHSSLSWTVLPVYRGELVSIQAGMDKVIPADIYDFIKQNAKNAKHQHIMLEDSDHQISLWMAKDLSRVKKFAKAVDSFNFVEM